MPLKRARGSPFFNFKNTPFYLTPVSSYITALNEAQNCERIPPKCLFFKSQKVAATGYYGIEEPFTRPNFKTAPFCCEVPVVGCQEPLVVRMA